MMTRKDGATIRAGGLAPFALFTAAATAVVLLGVAGCMTPPGEYLANGCKVGPNYTRPDAEVTENWIDYRSAGLAEGSDELKEWWQQLDDPILNDLIAEALKQNLTLREAGLRIAEAAALRRVAVGELFPQQQQITADYTRSMVSRHNASTRAAPARYSNLWQVGAGLSWELDFWGRFRRGIESADATLEASLADFADVQVLLTADVARTYIEIRTLQQRLEYTRVNVETQQKSLDLTRERYEAGATSRLDVDQAEANVAQTRALIPQLRTQLRQAENRLCVLLGIAPQDITARLGGLKEIPDIPAEVVVGVPAELVRRRPDVVQAERLAAAQSARIGIAEADLYPTFLVSGNIGYGANNTNNLFNKYAAVGSVGPSVQWNVLNYGRLVNSVYAEEARFYQLVVAYQNTVLNAAREAEDAITAFLRSKEQARALAASAEAAQDSLNLLQELYKEGKVDFGRVFFAQVFLAERQDELAAARGAIVSNLVDVYRALGGGWDISQITDSKNADPQAMMTETQAPAENP